MEEFASYFRQIRALRDKITDPSLGPVKVAVIDDGADITHPDLKDAVILGKSFHHYRDGSTWRVSPYWDSPCGHGTLMARLILRICPSASIHVIKLQTVVGVGSENLHVDPDSAREVNLPSSPSLHVTDNFRQAIEYATKLRAHIISMSWTIKPPSDPTKKQAFDYAIHSALNEHNILIFCAASDHGKSADRTYPHASNPNSFRIGAARSTGSLLDQVSDSDGLSFLFPGHDVVVDRAYEDAQLREFEAHTGSSVACALATGLAALIIECVRLGVFYTNETTQRDPSVAIRSDDLVKIRELRQMEYALKSIGTDRNTNNRYIEVWDTFSDVADKLKNNEGDRLGQLEAIAGIARVFLRKGVWV